MGGHHLWTLWTIFYGPSFMDSPWLNIWTAPQQKKRKGSISCSILISIHLLVGSVTIVTSKRSGTKGAKRMTFYENKWHHLTWSLPFEGGFDSNKSKKKKEKKIFEWQIRRPKPFVEPLREPGIVKGTEMKRGMKCWWLAGIALDTRRV